MREKVHERFARMTQGAATAHLPAVHLQGRKQRDHSMTHIFDRVPFRMSRSQGQGRLDTVQCLNRGLLFDAENRCLFWRFGIQTEDVFGLGLKIGIGTGHIALQAVRLQSALAG